jgi:hypothetical protein
MKIGPLALLGAVLLLACQDSAGKDDLNLNYREPMVWGMLAKVTDDELAVTYEKYFQVFDRDGLRMVPVVTLNGRPVAVTNYSPTEYDYGDSDVIPTYRRHDLEVEHYWGVGFCHLVMPGDFALTLPPREFLLGQDSALTTAWGASSGAQWYWLSIYISYDYDDTLGYEQSFEFRLDTLMHDTAITVAPEHIYPVDVVQVLAGYGSVTVWSGNGSPDEPGDIGNVRGCAVGFVNAINEPPSQYFYVGAPPAERPVPERRGEFGRFKTRLRGRLPERQAGGSARPGR